MNLRLNDWLFCFSPLGLLFLAIFSLIHVSDVSSQSDQQKLWPTHYRIGSTPSINGKGIEGKCLDYAIELRTQLVLEADLRPEILVFNWWDPEGEAKGTHAIIYYRDDLGETWVVDNQTPNPVPVYAPQSKKDLILPLVKKGLIIESLENQMATIWHQG